MRDGYVGQSAERPGGLVEWWSGGPSASSVGFVLDYGS